MLTFGTRMGPCGLMDDVGLHSVLAVEQTYYEDSGHESDRPPRVLTDLVRRNALGVTTGTGFYDYPNPAFEDPRFLNPKGD